MGLLQLTWRTPVLCRFRHYASPLIGALPVAEVDTDLVVHMLRPIWNRVRTGHDCVVVDGYTAVGKGADPPMGESLGPASPPAAVDGRVDASGGRPLMVTQHMPTSSFRFSGKTGEHELVLQCSLWGHERYLVDGKPVLNVWTVLPTGVRELSVDGRSLKIVYTIKSWMTQADAFVDGEQVANDMFAEFNHQFMAQLGSWTGVKVMLPFFLAGAAVTAAGIFLLKTLI